MYTIDSLRWNNETLDAETQKKFAQSNLGETIENYSLEMVDCEKSFFNKTYDGPRPAMLFCDADHSYEGTREDLV